MKKPLVKKGRAPGGPEDEQVKIMSRFSNVSASEKFSGSPSSPEHDDVDEFRDPMDEEDSDSIEELQDQNAASLSHNLTASQK